MDTRQSSTESGAAKPYQRQISKASPNLSFFPECIRPATNWRPNNATCSIILPDRHFGGILIPSQTASLSASGNLALSNAKKTKQDEFYTQLADIENELKHYKSQLRGKTILCNCDDPFESNFFRYFALNFNTLGLKKLIATSYVKSPIVGGQLPLLDIEGLKPEGKEPYAIEINEVPDRKHRGA